MVEPAPAPKAPGQRKIVRTVFMVLVWLLSAALLVQVLLIGLGLFYEASYLEAHAGLGWILGHNIAPIVMIVGLFCKLGRTGLIVTVVNLVLILALPILAAEREAAGGLVSALHPLTAVAVVVLTLYLAAKARSVVPAPWGSAPATPKLAAPTPPPAAPSLQQGRPL